MKDIKTDVVFKWARRAKGYECSTVGDRRFSALVAKMEDGRSIEMHYQLDIKGYQPGGRDWRLGKGKPPLDKSKDLWKEYLGLWRLWAKSNPLLLMELASLASIHNDTLTDTFASTGVSQARALSYILNETFSTAEPKAWLCI